MPDKEREERRRYKRIKKNLYVQCGPWNAAGVWSSVVLKDISTSGLSFLASKEFAVDEVLEVRVTTFMRPQPISLVCRVLGCNKESERKNWITRASIIRVSDEDKGVFQEVIQAFLKESEEKNWEAV
jgi:hypothetical protein